MAFSTNTFTYAGGARTFTLSLGLGYLEESDIRCFVEGEVDGNGDQVYRIFTFDSEFVVRITDDITIGLNVTVERTVDKDALVVDFETGGTITPKNLMLITRQTFMAFQELLDGRIGELDLAALTAAAVTLDATQFIHKDGSVPFLEPQPGVVPTLDAHLTTKKYVDDSSATGAGDIKADGTVAMQAPLDLAVGSPTDPEHAARKDYVDQQTALRTTPAYVDAADALKADLASPDLTGNPTTPDQAAFDDSGKIANTRYADEAARIGGAFGHQLLHLRDLKVSGVSGGTHLNSTWEPRVINTVVTNEIAGASIASNRITLPAGDYWWESEDPTFSTGGEDTQSRLYSPSQGELIHRGTSMSRAGSSDSTIMCLIRGRFSTTLVETFELQTWSSSSGNSTSLGAAVGSGIGEAYSDIRIWRV